MLYFLSLFHFKVPLTCVYTYILTYINVSLAARDPCVIAYLVAYRLSDGLQSINKIFISTKLTFAHRFYKFTEWPAPLTTNILESTMNM